jgi:glycosyltransferase involved in cell wall biosynthesis
MRILFCAAEAPLPPLNGGRLQISNLAAGLARRHEVDMVAYRWPDQHGEPPEGIAIELLPSPPRMRKPVALVPAALRGLPTTVVEETSPMAAAARRHVAAGPPDVVHVAGARLAAVIDALGSCAAVLAPLDAWHLNAEAAARLGDPLRRLVRRREAWAVRRFSRYAYRRYASVVMVSEEDAAAARELDPALHVEVVPNGVDTLAYAPNDALEREPGLVVFVGAMQWAPNAEAAMFLAHEIWPRVRDAVPDARLALVGRRPDEQVRALARLPGVEVPGEVPDVRPWLWRASAFVCPMISGTGIKNKLLEAMACGVPSVATPLARQGMRVTPGRELVIAAEAAHFAEQLVRLLRDADLRQRLGAAARYFVVREHSWEAAVRSYERIYQQAIDRGARA